MKASNQTVVGLLGLSLLLLGYSIATTYWASKLEQRLNRREASCQELNVKHRVLANTLSRVSMTPELRDSLMAALAREGSRPAYTNGQDLRLLGTEFNSPPQGVM